MRFRLLLCCLLSSSLHAEDDWRSILRRIDLSVAAAVKKSNNYICVQDLTRSYYVAVRPAVACRQPREVPSSPMRMQDRLKLDVAVSNGGEIYSWHGERKFAGGSVSEVVEKGPISSGSFSGYLRNIFGEHGVHFAYLGRKRVNGFEFYQFDYDVPLAASHYRIQAGKGFELAPFYGSFTARVDSYELASLTVTATGDHLSAKTNICATQTSLTFQMVKIGDVPSPLPDSFTLLVGSRNGLFTESRGRFTQCREYRGESTITFEDEDVGPSKREPELQPQPLRSGLVLPVTFQTEIDEDTAYAGMPVEAVLRRNVRLNRQLVLSRGATLHGTLTRFEIFYQPRHSVGVKFEFDHLTDGDKLYLCKAVRAEPAEFQTTFTNRDGHRGGAGANIRTSTGADPNDGMEMFDSAHFHQEKGSVGDFVTVSEER